jgi:OOP family OmpA-OmpF porin
LIKKILMVAAVAAACTALPASAQFYLGGGVGEAKTDTRETSWKMYGGFQFNPTWGVELGYTDLGKYRGADIESYSLAMTGTMPLNEQWSLLGKLGVAENRPDAAGNGNKTSALIGVGVGYSFNKNVGMRLEYEDFGKLSDAGNSSSGKNLGLSLKYNF